jgi:hypothetical protein
MGAGLAMQAVHRTGSVDTSGNLGIRSPRHIPEFPSSPGPRGAAHGTGSAQLGLGSGKTAVPITALSGLVNPSSDHAAT